jgi:PAS domain S-box-containing protein
VGHGVTLPRASVGLRYGTGLALFGLALSVEMATWPLFAPSPFILFFGAVTVSAWLGGWKPGSLVSVLSALAGQFLLVEPRFRFALDAASGTRLIVFLGICALICVLCQQLRDAALQLEDNQDALRAEQSRLEQAFLDLSAERAQLSRANEQLQVQAEEMEVQAEEVKAQADELHVTGSRLRQQLAYTEAIAGSLEEGICAIDPTGRFTYVNAACERMLGWPRGDLIGLHMHESVHYRHDDGTPYPAEECPLHQARAAGSTVRGEDTLVRRDGTMFPISYATSPLLADGRLVGQVIAFSDIRARRQAESALRVSTERLSIALEAGHMGTWDWDPHTGITVWSSGQEAIYGLPPGGYDGRSETYLGLIHPEDRDRVARVIEESAKIGGEHHVRHRIVRPDGAIRWVDGRGKAFLDDQGELVRMVGVTIDVTEREQAAATIRQLNQTLEQRVEERTAELNERNTQLSETVAELESFSHTVSHDLRAPIRAMHGFAEAILEDLNGREGDPRDHVRRIIEAAERMDALIQDLMAYSRVSRAMFRPEPVSLAMVVDEVLTQMSEEIAERRARVEVQLQPGLPNVSGHRSTIFQIVSNLVANAIKFVAPGIEPRVRIRGEHLGNKVRLWIEDNGIGIEPRYKNRIFRVFERLHSTDRYPGTGVGLAIVQKAVERMHGDIDFESEPDKGSRFWIELPTS